MLKYDVHSPEAREEIIACITNLFGEFLSPENIEEWYRMLMDEVESYYDGDYNVLELQGRLHFGQCGEKEYSHDGSYEPYKGVDIERITEEEYNKAKGKMVKEEPTIHEYKNGWLERGSERFITYWEGRLFDYYYYAKDLAGFPFVKITITD